MSFNLHDLRAGIDALKGARGKPFDALHTLLLNNEAVEIPGVGHAIFVQEQEEERDYYNEGEIYYVFKVGDRHFKIDGHYSSYNGARYENRILEVKPAAKVRYIWEAVK